MKNFKHPLIPVAAAFALLLGGTAIAQAPTFEELDADANGLISRSEAQVLPCLASNFDVIEKADPNGLNGEEFVAAVSEYCSA